MGFLLSKVATQLAYPLTCSIALGVLGLFLLWRRRRGAAAAALVTSLAILWVSSTEAFAVALASALERQYPPVAVGDLPKAEAIVVLGGGVRMPLPPELWSDLEDGGDRVLHAARIHRAGKAPWVVASGGAMPWSRSEIRPAEGMADLLEEWGVPREAILVETQSRNTYENAVRTKALLDERGIDDVLLVTSAIHMRRALAVFRSQGLHVEPAATDYHALYGTSGTWMGWLPSASKLLLTHTAFKEYLGYWVYRMRGWIRD